MNINGTERRMAECKGSKMKVTVKIIHHEQRNRQSNSEGYSHAFFGSVESGTPALE
jgi:hypothetical protein